MRTWLIDMMMLLALALVLPVLGLFLVCVAAVEEVRWVIGAIVRWSVKSDQ